MTATTLEEVIAKLEDIISQTHKSGDRSGYFAALYYKVTVKVKEGIAAGQFGDGVNIARLDVQFANRYFQAYDSWQQGKPVTKSWEIAFTAANRRSCIILQHLLVGMNAHINLDLGIAACEVSDGDLDKLRVDYNNINLILSSLTYGVISQLNLLSPFMSILGFRGTKSNSMLVQFSLGNARDGSWCFAEELALLQGEKYEEFIVRRDEEIAELGGSLVKNSGFLKIGVWLIHLFENKNVRYVIEVLNDGKKPYKKELKGFRL
ncbi:hypothetical protein SAMN05444266_10918 [Chitinophaga jiangningensis]|uniref:Uncharacterized protein n=1 Tax=Chitinophaga jiangningensis TaxID=1419482 RepID=A0A1M7JTM8_9BACT|nr:DUF5995 family protein [Chitinophaga jiangningensis]SHM56382.1 hypothetical protein SAMN05444266_10918 [Chitinophaga jiangningensis]